MSFLRPEAVAGVQRWREVIIGAGAALLGAWWVIGPGGLLSIPGTILILGGAALVWVGVQRARFRGAQGGVGAVHIDEGQITYFGPISGGTISLKELERLSLDATATPAHWRLDQPGEPPLFVPVNAAGSDALFDAFASLKGLKTERMLAELRSGKPQAVVIWERTPLRPARAVLH